MKWLKRSFFIALLLAVGIGLGWFAAGWLPDGHKQLPLAESPTGGEFAFVSRERPMRLSDLRGKVVLIYFGYTFCPDICPTNLALMAQAFNAMSADELEGIQGVFISFDPERDTPKRLEEYTAHFHARIMGATGDAAELARVAKSYGVVYERVEGQSLGGYLIDHSSFTYVIAPDGSLHTALPHATPAAEIIKTVRTLLPQTGS